MKNKEDEVIEAQEVPPQALTIVPKQVVAPGLFGATEPREVIAKAAEVATALKEVVIKQGLVSNINGKQYPKCEAWTLLGTILGVFPVLVWTRKVEGGWEARVEAKTKDGAIVGAAEAQCLNTEKNWANRDEFALRSMAQTRATAKCLRMPLGFVMTLSGFEATPAEEMVSEPKPHVPKEPPIIRVPQKAKMPTPATRSWMLNELNALHPGDPGYKLVTEYFQKAGQLLPNEILGDLPLRFVPYTVKELEQLASCIANFEAGGDAVAAFEAHVEADAPKEPEPKPWDKGQKPIEVPREAAPNTNTPTEASSEPWYKFIVPVPHKGEKRDAYLKHPDTIGSLYEARHDDEEARKRLWGFLNNYEPKGWKKRDGTEMPPSKTDIQFREMLDSFGTFFEKNHPDETL